MVNLMVVYQHGSTTMELLREAVQFSTICNDAVLQSMLLWRILWLVGAPKFCRKNTRTWGEWRRMFISWGQLTVPHRKIRSPWGNVAPKRVLRSPPSEVFMSEKTFCSMKTCCPMELQLPSLVSPLLFNFNGSGCLIYGILWWPMTNGSTMINYGS